MARLGPRRRVRLGIGLAGTVLAMVGTSPTVAGGAGSALQGVIGPVRAVLATRAAFTLTLTPASVGGARARPVHGTGAFDFASARGVATLRQPTGKERVVFLPASVFVHQANAAGVLPAGKSWVSAGLTEQALATNFPQFVTQAESLSPLLLLCEVAWGASSATATGHGGGATEYTVRVSLTDAAGNASGPAGAALAKAITYQAAGVATGANVDVRVWVGTSGRVTRLQASPPGSGMGTITMGLSHYGVHVSVSAPPSSAVVDVATLAPGGERENSGGGDSDGA